MSKQNVEGRIIKGIAGFYYVHIGGVVYACKAKGIFRKDSKKPLVGDRVLIDILDQEKLTGNLVEICPRMNEMLRPQVANVDQAIVYFALADPKPNWEMLDKLLIRIAFERIPIMLVFNKRDLQTNEQIEEVRSQYAGTGYRLFMISAADPGSVAPLRRAMIGKTSVLAGPSGVGKSTFTNLLQPTVWMETQAISEKISRGKHTTRHAQLIPFAEDSFLVDTPGFTSIDVPTELETIDLQNFYPEFAPYLGACRFRSCLHKTEPACRVRQAVRDGEISEQRWQRYMDIVAQLEQRKRY